MDSVPGFQHAKSITLVCRLCFMERKQLEFIFENDSQYLSEWIEKLTSLKITNIPNAPASLCSNCKSTLEAFDAFREMCITNDHVFNDTFCRRNNIEMNEFAAVKLERVEDQNMDIEAAAALNPSVKSEIVTGYDNIDVASTELLEAKVQDVYIGTPSDAGENEHSRVESTTPEDEIKIEHHEISYNFRTDCDEQTMETEKAEENVQVPPSVKVVLSDTVKYPCEVCNTSSPRLHILTHQQPELFQCFVCSKQFRRFNLVSQHIFKSHKDEPISGVQSDLPVYNFGDFECQICKRTESQMHIKTHIAKGMFQCYICAKKFNRIVKCLKHISWHSRPPSSCNFCRICMKRASKLHAKTHKAMGLYACQFCEKTFKKVWSLKVHMEQVHDEKDDTGTTEAAYVPSSEEAEYIAQLKYKEKPIPVLKDDEFLNQKCLATCKICNQSVSKLHMKTHKAKSLFACYICKKMFKQYVCLTRHINLHKTKQRKVAPNDQASDNKKPQQHEADDNSQLQMSIVSTSETSDSMQQPDETLTNSTAPDDVVQNKARGRNFECKICNTLVTKLHAESHKAEGFQCPICLCHYNKFEQYSRHIKCHKDQGKFVCKLCKKVLANAFSMVRHEKLHNRHVLDTT